MDIGEWVPLLEYAVRRNVSTSTLRRHIKANKIRFKLENGRYLIWDESSYTPPPEATTGAGAVSGLPYTEFNRIKALEAELARANEQVADLKMLVAIYEEKLAGKAR